MRWRNRFRALATTTALTGLILVGQASSPAFAVAAGCTATGVSGTVNVDGYTAGSHNYPYVYLSLADTAADGHHVRIRFISLSAAGPHTYYPWHALYDGNGTSTGWSTSAYSAATTAGFAVQAAVYEGDDQIRYCTDYKWY
ncbi:hypothetical protein ACFQ9Z_34260 [Streptomyces sp. NPDC056580]|uniref:hypothetical protein n=1 Tax=Streptomyces sp. NPDC056580 TaxID=3345872 RepID=UPI00368B0C5C